MTGALCNPTPQRVGVDVLDRTGPPMKLGPPAVVDMGWAVPDHVGYGVLMEIYVRVIRRLWAEYRRADELVVAAAAAGDRQTAALQRIIRRRCRDRLRRVDVPYQRLVKGWHRYEPDKVVVWKRGQRRKWRRKLREAGI